MTIRVVPETIDKETFQKILDYYNANKPEDEEPLERLPRAEGGFQIQLTDMKDKYCDDNKKIRQLRWNSIGQLVSRGYIDFTAKQGTLLYEALVYGLGKANVIID